MVLYITTYQYYSANILNIPLINTMFIKLFFKDARKYMNIRRIILFLESAFIANKSVFKLFRRNAVAVTIPGTLGTPGTRVNVTGVA